MSGTPGEVRRGVFGADSEDGCALDVIVAFDFESGGDADDTDGCVLSVSADFETGTDDGVHWIFFLTDRH